MKDNRKVSMLSSESSSLSTVPPSTASNGIVSCKQRTTTTSALSSSSAITIHQSIGGHTYALTLYPKKRWEWSRIVKFLLSILLSPILLPLFFLYILLIAIPFLRGWIFRWLLPIGMKALNKRLHTERWTLLEHCSGDVLDVGTGSGAYFPYYYRYNHDRNENNDNNGGSSSSSSSSSRNTLPPIRSVVAVEPVQELHPVIRQAAQKARAAFSQQAAAARGGGSGLQVSWKDDLNMRIVSDLSNLIMSAGETTGGKVTTSSPQPQQQFDWIILGNVLCEVPSISETLQQVDTLLKPGGHVFFSEHIACPAHSWWRILQDGINPLWRYVMVGCNCNRDSLDHIQQRQPDWDVVYWTIPTLKVCGSDFVVGLAYKKPSIESHDGGVTDLPGSKTKDD